MFESEISTWAPGTLDGLDDIEPGWTLGVYLSRINLDDLSGHDRVVVLRAHQRMASHYSAHAYGAMAAVSDSIDDLDDDPLLAAESAATEIRAALQLTRRAADSELSFALDLRTRLPRVWQLLAGGAIDPRRARTIVYATSHLPISTAHDIVDRIIDEAPRLTTGQLSARIRRLAIDADPEQATDRYRAAIDNRRVVSEPTPDGTTNLFGFDLPPSRVATITDRINHLARSLRSATETRTMDQLRADVLLDLLDGSSNQPPGRRGSIDIHVDLTTLTRLDNQAGDLAGYGPVIADIARQVAEQETRAEWRYTITDPDTGRVVHNGITRRRPTRDQRREVEARDPRCIFPGCRMPATDCDIDHCQPYGEGGPTVTPNLAPLCRHDHGVVRHGAGWVYELLSNGDNRWTSKLGHVYTTSGTPP
ncbi:MAG: HNH endonuclease [Acidimicrobiia bacterium]|nr:HNH endonuclease [Acidimicrobiia bacterium]